MRGEKPFGYAVLNKIGGTTDNLVLFNTQGPLFYLNPPKPLPEFEKKQNLQDAIASGDAETALSFQKMSNSPITVPMMIAMTSRTRLMNRP